MLKRLAIIFLVLIGSTCLSAAKSVCAKPLCAVKFTLLNVNLLTDEPAPIDTTKKKPEPEDKKKIKEIPMARRQVKPLKLGELPTDSLKSKIKPARQRRPDGLVRPPEIPRRNNN